MRQEQSGHHTNDEARDPPGAHPAVSSAIVTVFSSQCRILIRQGGPDRDTHPAPGATTSVAVTVLTGLPVSVASVPPSTPVAGRLDSSTHESSPLAFAVILVHKDARPIAPWPAIASYPCRMTREPAGTSTSHMICRVVLYFSASIANCRTCGGLMPMMRFGWTWLNGSDQVIVSGSQDWRQRKSAHL